MSASDVGRSETALHLHAWKPEWSAESPYCGEMVWRDGGGDTCGLLRDDPIHAPDRAGSQT